MRVKRTQGELKRQRDALSQYERYLPTLQLKKQQLLLEVLHQQQILAEKQSLLTEKRESAHHWSGLLTEAPDISRWLIPETIIIEKRNIAGVELPFFKKVTFPEPAYDLFLMPLWLDEGLEFVHEIVACMEEIQILEQGIAILKQELRITTQRVNLFEKIRIPEVKEAIRQIRIAISDQMTNDICRSKIVKSRIEEVENEDMMA